MLHFNNNYDFIIRNSVYYWGSLDALLVVYEAIIDKRTKNNDETQIRDEQILFRK